LNRSNGCFGNEKELRTVWQNMRVNAAKVYKNDIFGSKLDRKVSRFIYGRPQNRSRNVTEGSSSLSEYVFLFSDSIVNKCVNILAVQSETWKY